MEVAELIRRRRTNREITDELGVSSRRDVATIMDAAAAAGNPAARMEMP